MKGKATATVKYIREGTCYGFKLGVHPTRMGKAWIIFVGVCIANLGQHLFLRPNKPAWFHAAIGALEVA